MRTNKLYKRSSRVGAALAAFVLVSAFAFSPTSVEEINATESSETLSVMLNDYHSDITADVMISEFSLLDFHERDNGIYRYVDAQNGRVYDGPDDEASVIAMVSYADCVVVQTDEESPTAGWIKVKLGDTVGYIHKDIISDNFVSVSDKSVVYAKDNAIAYSSPSVSNADGIIIPFNTELEQQRSNGRWSICNIDGETRYLLKTSVSNSLNFRDSNKTSYIKDTELTVYESLNDDNSELLIDFNYDDAVTVEKENDEWATIIVNGEEYYVRKEYLSSYKDLVKEECKDRSFNKKYDNTEILNRLNTYYSEDIANSFDIGNEELKKTVGRYIENAKKKVGENASPAEIAYECYIALMDNAVYRFNIYASKVKSRYGLTDNSGSYRAAAIMDENIGMGACQNYASAMTAILRTLGFDAEVVGGDGAASGPNGHFWCQVENLVFDAQIDDSNKNYGLRFGRTSGEIIKKGHSGYYVTLTKANCREVRGYNLFP